MHNAVDACSEAPAGSAEPLARIARSRVSRGRDAESNPAHPVMIGTVPSWQSSTPPQHLP